MVVYRSRVRRLGRQPTGVPIPAGGTTTNASPYVVCDNREPEYRTGSAHEALTALGIIDQSAPSVNGRCFLNDRYCGTSFQTRR